MAESRGYLQVWDRFLYVQRPNPNNASQIETWAILGIDQGFDMSEPAGTMYLEGADEGRIVYYDAYQHKRVVRVADTGLQVLSATQDGAIAIDPEGWIWYAWTGLNSVRTKRAVQHVDSDHGDQSFHEDSPARDRVDEHGDDSHADHNDNSSQHTDWLDHYDTPHDNRNPHSDRNPSSHSNWSDTYSDSHTDHNDHQDRRISDPGGPHLNWTDVYVDTYQAWTDYYNDTHKNWSDSYTDTHYDSDPHENSPGYSDHINRSHLDYGDWGYPYENQPYWDHTDNTPHSNWSDHINSGYSDAADPHANSGYSDSPDPHQDQGYIDQGNPHDDWSDSYKDIHDDYNDHSNVHSDSDPRSHSNWSDSYSDWSDHYNTAHVDRASHNDLHSDYTDHANLPHNDKVIYSDAPHFNWSDHNDASHYDNPRFLGYDPSYRDWSDHNDLAVPHSDWNDHLDQVLPVDIRQYTFSKTWAQNEAPYPFRDLVPSGTLYPSSSLYPVFRPDLRITWVAWGNGSSSSGGKLGNELGRVPITMISQTQTQIYTEAYIGPHEANTTITEIGWFGGDSASEEKDSGVMLARETVSITKTPSQALLIIRIDTRGW